MARATTRSNSERTVLSLYYHEELTLREIARVMELHESRISQLKGQALLRLRSYMQKCWPEKGRAQSVRCAAAGTASMASFATRQ